MCYGHGMKSNKGVSRKTGVKDGKTEKVTLELPTALVREIDSIAGKEDRNRSSQIRFFLRLAVRQRMTEEL